MSLHTVKSEGVECSLESWESPEVEGVVINYGQRSTEIKPQELDSESNESSQNSRRPNEVGVSDFEHEEKTVEETKTYSMAVNPANLPKIRRYKVKQEIFNSNTEKSH